MQERMGPCTNMRVRPLQTIQLGLIVTKRNYFDKGFGATLSPTPAVVAQFMPLGRLAC